MPCTRMDRLYFRIHIYSCTAHRICSISSFLEHHTLSCIPSHNPTSKIRTKRISHARHRRSMHTQLIRTSSTYSSHPTPHTHRNYRPTPEKIYLVRVCTGILYRYYHMAYASSSLSNSTSGDSCLRRLEGGCQSLSEYLAFDFLSHG